MESKEQNKPTKLKQAHRFREQTDGCQKEGGLGVWVRKVKGLKRTNWWLQNSLRSVKYGIGNIFTSTVLTLCGVGQARKISGGSPRQVSGCLTTLLRT